MSPLEDGAFLGQPIERRRLDVLVAVGAEEVDAGGVGHDDEDVPLPRLLVGGVRGRQGRERSPGGDALEKIATLHESTPPGRERCGSVWRCGMRGARKRSNPSRKRQRRKKHPSLTLPAQTSLSAIRERNINARM